ncbi:MAG: PipX family protein [Pseudanabaenaceae cyanobacterium SKYGB_i_bin29]|nr:PipX family protein [Pseudanabaenaceae cyanobacterium SKYG29]MDW8421610.1 PipX family protein [Pseudanabaenaceae cyanobacterium SKYGB_i_bin29]
MTETYLNHPTFGLLSRICVLDEQRSLFTTLYAHRLFFIITTANGTTQFEPLTRGDAKMLVETKLRNLRREGNHTDLEELQHIFKRTFA